VLNKGTKWHRAAADDALTLAPEVIHVTPPTRRKAVQRIIQLYEAWGKLDKAAEWRAEQDKPVPPAESARSP
jgi:hypothetical protein